MEPSLDLSRFLGEPPGPFERLIGMRLTHVDASRVEAVLPITPELLQGHDIVHGGVYCSAIESTASIGASLRRASTAR
jgi:uncharacterized protein (TIGR00369 family)